MNTGVSVTVVVLTSNGRRRLSFIYLNRPAKFYMTILEFVNLFTKTEVLLMYTKSYSSKKENTCNCFTAS